MAVLSEEGVEAKLRELHGNMAAVARHFGVTRAAVWKYVQERPALVEVTKDCRETMKDHAESALYRSVMNSEPWAVKWYLGTQAKDRGYVERQEHEHSGGVALGVVEEIVDADSDKDRPAAPGTGGVPAQ